MEEFKKMVAYLNKKYKPNKGKISLGKRTGGKLSSKLLKSGKKSQK